MEPPTVPFRGLRLPRGRGLDREVWESRHRWLLWLLWLQAAALAVDGAVTGYGLFHNAGQMAALVGFGLAGAFGPDSRTARGLFVTLGLFTESALVVHHADGATAAHFHFFVMVAALSLYEDAVPFAVGIAFIFLQHGIAGMVAPESVYTEESSIQHPWAWAAIHGGFLAAAAVAQVLAWNANERVRGRLRRAERVARAERDRAERFLHDVEAAAEVAHSVAREQDARATVAETARKLVGAAFVMLAEPGDDALELTVSAGIPLPKGRLISFADEPSGAAVAFTTAEPYFVARTDGERAISGRLVEATEAVSLLFQPAISGGSVRGVLCIGWRHPVDALDSREVRVAALLADEAALAIERAGQLRDLEEAATTDALTGVGNRRAWDRALAAELASAAAARGKLAVAVLDLDRFKALNDQHGHQAGDRALKGCVAAWRAQLRPSDVLARLGGDEFALLLPGCDLPQAEVIRERLETLTPHLAGVSVGVAEWDGAEPGEQLMQRADRDLYGRKAARS